MSGYYLREEGFPFKKIYHGRKWVGRVYQHQEGHWVGQIGKNSSRIEARGRSSKEAFEEVAARAMGFRNAAALHAHNTAARQQRRAIRVQARAIATDMLRGDYSSFDAAVKKMLDKDEVETGG